MTGSGSGGELTFVDLKKRLAQVAARMAPTGLPPGSPPSGTATVNSVTDSTPQSGDER